MAATNVNSAAKARKIESQGKALEMRRMGMGYAEIARQLDCSLSTAHGYIKVAMADAKAQIDADAGEMKAEEISRLDGMLRGLWPDARKGNHGAVDRVLKIMERRAKLLGLDAPVKMAHGGDADAPAISHKLDIHTLADAELERIAANGSP
jgi:hypothetical protein